jgi:hypothetical protein
MRLELLNSLLYSVHFLKQYGDNHQFKISENEGDYDFFTPLLFSREGAGG